MSTIRHARAIELDGVFLPLGEHALAAVRTMMSPEEWAALDDARGADDAPAFDEAFGRFHALLRERDRIEPLERGWIERLRQIIGYNGIVTLGMLIKQHETAIAPKPPPPVFH